MAYPDCPRTNIQREMPSQGAERFIHHIRWEHQATGLGSRMREKPARQAFTGGRSNYPPYSMAAQVIRRTDVSSSHYTVVCYTASCWGLECNPQHEILHSNRAQSGRAAALRARFPPGCAWGQRGY